LHAVVPADFERHDRADTEISRSRCYLAWQAAKTAPPILPACWYTSASRFRRFTSITGITRISGSLLSERGQGDGQAGPSNVIPIKDASLIEGRFVIVFHLGERTLATFRNVTSVGTHKTIWLRQAHYTTGDRAMFKAVASSNLQDLQFECEILPGQWVIRV
jgi:hypothetical protein